MSEEVKTEGTFKVKKKPGRPKKLNKSDEVVKLDLTKKEEQAEETTIEETPNQVEETVEQVEETPAVETKEEVVEDSPIVELNKQEEETKEIKPLVDQPKIPDNLEKLVDFMRETGGTIEDYVRLNADYSSVSEDVLLREYYLPNLVFLRIQ